PIWQETVGIPDRISAPGNVRTYSLLTNRFPDHTSLYVRVQDKDNGIVYSTYSLGRTISFEEPQAQIDRANQLHVLQCAAPRSWAYSRIGLNGELLAHSSFMETKTRPRLFRAADGEVADRGGIPGQRIPEKEMTLDVAQRLKALLAASGYRVIMTRDSDIFVPLPTRVSIANSYQNAIFVCIHFNSAKRMGASGIETYFYSHESLPLASAVHYYVAGGAPTSNRGVRRRGFYVLRKTKIPAVLVECGFLTNPSEGDYAQTTSYRQ